MAGGCTPYVAPKETQSKQYPPENRCLRLAVKRSLVHRGGYNSSKCLTHLIRLNATSEAMDSQAPREMAARDPICGMIAEGSPHQYQHNGRTYYFCCPRCLERFRADPD